LSSSRSTLFDPDHAMALSLGVAGQLHRYRVAHSHSFSAAARFLLTAIGSLFFVCCSALAQDAIPPTLPASNQPVLTPGEVEALQPGPPPAATNTNTNADANTTIGRPYAETPRRFQYNFSVTLRGVYDDNINISSFNRVSDFYVAIEPSLFLGLGGSDSDSVNSLSLTYRPSIFLYADNSQFDTVQHLVRLQGARNFGRLSLSLSQDMQILNGPDLNSLSDPTGHTANIDVGGRTKHNIYTTQLSGSYDLTGKLFLSGAGFVSVDDYSGPQIGSQNFSGNLFINYHYSEKLVLGVGGTGGYNTVDNNSSPDQTYEQANARLDYSATAKINLSASGGLEFRQFGNNSRGTYLSPVYTLSATYQPFDGTAITLNGSRHTANSASLAGQDYASTDINFAVNQRFMQRASLGFAVGYENADYFSAINGVAATRNDDYYYVEPSVDVKIMRFWTVGAYFLHRQNTSSFNFFGFYDNQVGGRTTLTF
jgi:hypothetical protein